MDPWAVTKKLNGASYELTHITSKKVTSKHAMHMSPVPPNIQAFVLLDSVDSRYGQIYCQININTYKQGGINGFLPHNLFKGFKSWVLRLCSSPASHAIFGRAERLATSRQR